MLSKRLKMIASLVTTESVIDVGCDHGYLDIYLTQKGIKCLATDISEKSLLKAIDNFKCYNLNIKTKLTDGLNGIDIKEKDTIIISGMGTDTINRILNKDINNQNVDLNLTFNDGKTYELKAIPVKKVVPIKMH